MTVNSTILEGSMKTDFLDNISYPVHQIRSILGSLIKKGVIAQTMASCKVVESEGKLKILPGIAVFEDGGIITIDVEGFILDKLEGDFYVYFKNGYLQGDSFITATNSPPTGDYLPLAEVTNGIIKDTRIFAEFKL